MATFVYDATEKEEHEGDLLDAIQQIFESFGVPVLPAGSDEKKIVAAVESKRPFLLNLQVRLMEKALRAGSMISLDSFFSTYSNLGAKTPEGTPLTADYIANKYGALLVQDKIPHDDFLIGLIFALGQERAKRRQPNQTHSAWGDELLDPIQFTLLNYSFAYSHGESALPSTKRLTENYVRLVTLDVELPKPSKDPKIPPGTPQASIELILNTVGKILGYPLGIVAPSTETVCASIWIFSHQLALSIEPSAIWHRQEDNPGVPYQSTAAATLVWTFVPHAEDTMNRRILELFGCGTFPEPGPVPGKAVVFKTYGLDGHGSFLPKKSPSHESKTDNHGKATAVFETVKETAPPDKRDEVKYVDGTVEAKALALYPKYDKLEIVIRELRKRVLQHDPGHVSDQLVVKYYEFLGWKGTILVKTKSPKNKITATTKGTITIKGDNQIEGDLVTEGYWETCPFIASHNNFRGYLKVDTTNGEPPYPYSAEILSSGVQNLNCPDTPQGVHIPNIAIMIAPPGNFKTSADGKVIEGVHQVQDEDGTVDLKWKLTKQQP